METPALPPSPPAPPPKPAPRWPKTIGIIAILFGAGGLLQALISPASSLLVKAQMQAYVDMGIEQAQVDDYLARLNSLSIKSGIANGCLGALLLTGGILILKRRKPASPLLQTWSVLKIVVGGFILFQSTALSRAQMSLIFSATAMSSGGGGSNLESAEAMMNQFANYGLWIGFAFGFIWLAALPVFLIIWFNRTKVRKEMADW